LVSDRIQVGRRLTDEAQTAQHDGDETRPEEKRSATAVGLIDARKRSAGRTPSYDDPVAGDDLVQMAERALADAEEAYRLDPSEANQRRVMSAWSFVRKARQSAGDEREAASGSHRRVVSVAALIETGSDLPGVDCEHEDNEFPLCSGPVAFDAAWDRRSAPSR
jgi:hypothetical protein